MDNRKSVSSTNATSGKKQHDPPDSHRGESMQGPRDE